MTTNEPFFIVGFPRSGTTLLQAMIMQLDGISIPPETHFFGALRRLNRLDTVNSSEDFDRALAVIKSDIVGKNELPVDWPKLEDEIRHNGKEDIQMFQVLLNHMKGEMQGCRRIGEKSPNHILWASELLDSIPGSKIVNIVRDGRDAAVSHAESLDKKSGLLSAACRWRYYQRCHRRLMKKYPRNRYTWVRYEDLVDQPGIEMQRLCEFLDEPYFDKVLSHHLRTESGFATRETHKMRTLEPITRSRVARYRKSLSSGEISMFQLVAGKDLVRLGYAIDKVSLVAGVVLVLRLFPKLLLGRLLLLVR